MIIIYILLGFAAGVVSGLVGIGGGIILIPALVYFFGMTQAKAQGTTLAIMVPPIGLLAAWVYYKQGNVNTGIAAFVCLGFFLGGFLGANLASGFTNETLRKIFGFVLLIIALRMILQK
ncbi:MAG: permease [Elusimicrobia bacterium RIFOXYA2_FULL_50_26]|nr:MAG: permease [Elusimicrobia bacterium RIFOXYA2_FULL_50_26]OGS24736.1 MAG: permease [Elusimicrobia bacterium RIFOXYB2_FULL_50_12]